MTAGLGAFVVFGGATAEFGPGQALALAVWAFLLASRARRKLRDTSDAGLLLDVEVGALLAIAVETALVRFDGGLNGHLSPALYVLVALVAAFSRPFAGLLVVLWILALEAGLRLAAPGRMDLAGFATHAGFVGTFALLNLTLLRAEVARIRVTARARVEAQLVRIREDARSYRLLGAGEAADREEVRSDRLARASVEEIHQSVHYALDLLRQSLGLNTAVLLWLNDAGTHLRISELSTASNEIQDAPLPAGEGVLGAVLAKRSAVRLENLKPTFRVPYYPGPCPVRVARGHSGARRRDAARRAGDRPARGRAVHGRRGGDRRAGRALLPPRDPERARISPARAREGRAGQAVPGRAGARLRAQRAGRRGGRGEGGPRDSRASTSPQ